MTFTSDFSAVTEVVVMSPATVAHFVSTPRRSLCSWASRSACCCSSRWTLFLASSTRPSSELRDSRSAARPMLPAVLRFEPNSPPRTSPAARSQLPRSALVGLLGHDVGAVGGGVSLAGQP